jgi:hypothetical protein
MDAIEPFEQGDDAEILTRSGTLSPSLGATAKWKDRSID